MRRTVVALIAMFLSLWTPQSRASSASTGLLASLQFETQRGSKCDLRVTGSATSGSRTLAVVCGEKTLFRKEMTAYLVDIQKHLKGDERLFIRWEQGHSEMLQVLRIGTSASNEDAVQELATLSSEFMPEALDSPDVILVYKGRQFGPDGDILPTGAEVLKWQGGKYVLSGRWSWKPTMTFDQRFCILHSTADCPAVHEN